MAQTATATTVPLDRWDLIADRLWQIPELGWAIAEANPDLAGYLFLPAGLPLVIPELRSLRRPLTAANPAREDDGEFPELPPDTPRPIVPPSGGGGSIVLPLAINQGGTGGASAQDALQNLGAVALSAVGVSVAPLVAGLVPVSNLPAFQSPLTSPIAIAQGGTGSATASAGLSALGGIAASQRGAANGIAPLDSNSLVPSSNLPPYPTLTSLNGVAVDTFNSAINSLVPIGAVGVANGVAPLNSSGIISFSFLPSYPTLVSLGALAASSRGAADGVAPLDSNSLVPVVNLPVYPTLASLGGIPVSQRGAPSGVAPLDSGSLVPSTNLPAYPTLASLGGVNLTTAQTVSGNKNFRGFTTLGDNIAIKQKFFSGTTAATQGATAQITHGIAGGTAKIISITGIITYAAGAFVSMNSPQVGFSAAISGDNTTINIYNLPSPGSASILSKPFVLLVQYIA